MRSTILSTCVAASVMVAAAVGYAQVPAEQSIDLRGALSSVRFAGQVPLEALEGKSSVVLVYASWCPKCNEWSPELFAQIKAASQASPVVVFAVNADKVTRGHRYALENGLTGPNIVYGDDPTIVERLGLESELFKYAVFNPEGKLIEKGNGGSFYTVNNAKDFVIANKMREGKLPGEFTVLKKDMAPPVKQALWPVEMGQPITDKSLLTLRGKLPEENHGEFNNAIRDFLDKHLARCEEGASGDVPEQIKAYTVAEVLATRFGTTPQGRQAKAIVAKFDEDTQFKKEVAAANYYERTMQTTNAAGAKRALFKVARRFEGTYYGDLAAKLAQEE